MRLFILSILIISFLQNSHFVPLLGAATLHITRHRLPSLLIRKTCPAQILINIQHDLERIAASAQRSIVKLLAQCGQCLVDAGGRLVLRLASAGVRQRALQDLVRGEGETELWRGTHDTRGSTLEESRGALLFQNCAGCVRETGIGCLALAGLDLETGLDDVEGGCEVGGGHTGDGTGGEELEDTELLGGRLAKDILLEVVVGREVDAGEGNIASQAGGCALVETAETKVADVPHGTVSCGDAGAFDGLLDGLALYLETDLDDFEGIREYLGQLKGTSVHCFAMTRKKKRHSPLDKHQHLLRQESLRVWRSDLSSCL